LRLLFLTRRIHCLFVTIWWLKFCQPAQPRWRADEQGFLLVCSGSESKFLIVSDSSWWILGANHLSLNQPQRLAVPSHWHPAMAGNAKTSKETAVQGQPGRAPAPNLPSTVRAGQPSCFQRKQIGPAANFGPATG